MSRKGTTFEILLVLLVGSCIASSDARYLRNPDNRPYQYILQKPTFRKWPMEVRARENSILNAQEKPDPRLLENGDEGDDDIGDVWKLLTPRPMLDKISKLNSGKNRRKMRLSKLTRKRRYEDVHSHISPDDDLRLRARSSERPNEVANERKEYFAHRGQDSDHMCYSALSVMMLTAGSLALMTAGTVMFVSCAFYCFYFHWWRNKKHGLFKPKAKIQSILTWGGGQGNAIAFSDAVKTTEINVQPFSEITCKMNPFKASAEELPAMPN